MCAHVCAYVSMCGYIYMCVYVYVCVCVCVCLCVSLHFWSISHPIEMHGLKSRFNQIIVI